MPRGVETNWFGLSDRWGPQTRFLSPAPILLAGSCFQCNLLYHAGNHTARLPWMRPWSQGWTEACSVSEELRDTHARAWLGRFSNDKELHFLHLLCEVTLSPLIKTSMPDGALNIPRGNFACIRSFKESPTQPEGQSPPPE